jgi:RimJ/RimL family protein N-acetyltransferase
MIPDSRSYLVDNTGHPFLIGECRRESLADLIEMYEAFTPKSVSQGLPPSDEETRHNWVRGLMNRGINFAVWIDGKIVGHSSLICDLDKKDGEYIIFVITPFRKRGLGSQLTIMAVQRARDLGLTKLWLTVESYNFRAIRLYQKVGFEFCGGDDLERVMALSL